MMMNSEARKREIERLASLMSSPSVAPGATETTRQETPMPEPCPSCDRDLSYPGAPGHECYTYAERAALLAPLATEDACGCYFEREHIERCAPASEHADLTASSLTYSDAATDARDAGRLSEEDVEALNRAAQWHWEQRLERITAVAESILRDRLAKVEAERDQLRAGDCHGGDE